VGRWEKNEGFLALLHFSLLLLLLILLVTTVDIVVHSLTDPFSPDLSPFVCVCVCVLICVCVFISLLSLFLSISFSHSLSLSFSLFLSLQSKTQKIGAFLSLSGADLDALVDTQTIPDSIQQRMRKMQANPSSVQTHNMSERLKNLSSWI
jgi:hypothetical protein